MSSKTDLAWSAGIIDGEGCIRITRVHRRPGLVTGYYLHLKVSMGSEETIRHLHNLFGVGCVVHSVTRQYSRDGNWNDVWSWEVNARKAGAVLAAIKPYSVTKRREIELAEEFLTIPRPSRRTKEGTREMERLYEALCNEKPRSRLLKYRRDTAQL